MTKIVCLFAVACALALSLSAPAQQNADAGRPYAEAMKKLSFLFGEWEGTGWVQMGQERSTYTVKESVHPRAGGTVVSFQGIGKDTKTGIVGHDAYGVMSYDLEKKAYTIRSYVMNGQSGVFPATIGDKSIVWEIKTDDRHIKYSISLDEKGQWVEIGEVKLDGNLWYKFMEMTLKKVSG
ncbi:MAG: hypothetical protein KF784_04015 [Fimbriimonadaceae bacterium]|nr:hypothetical protein [Fimbriimonadaceae bacterium]